MSALPPPPPVPPPPAALTPLSCQDGNISVGVSWDFAVGSTPRDLDVSAVCFNDVGSVVDAAYYNQLLACDGAVKHSGDERTGSKAGNDETIFLDLAKLQKVSAIVFCLSAFSGGSLVCCETAHVTINHGTDVMMTFNASNGETGRKTGLLLCMLFKGVDGKWYFESIMEPVGAKDFHASISNMRKHVDSKLGAGIAADRKFQPDKKFDMKKGDSLEVPRGVCVCVCVCAWHACMLYVPSWLTLLPPLLVPFPALQTSPTGALWWGLAGPPSRDTAPSISMRVPCFSRTRTRTGTMVRETG